MSKAAFYVGNHTIENGGSVLIQPAADEVQINVSHVGICGTDLHIYHGVMDKRVTFPQIMGHEMSCSAAGRSSSSPQPPPTMSLGRFSRLTGSGWDGKQ